MAKEKKNGDGLDDTRPEGRVEPETGNVKTTNSAGERATRIRVETEPGEQEENIDVHGTGDAQPQGKPGAGRTGKKVRKAKLTPQVEDYLRSREVRDSADRRGGELIDDYMEQADTEIVETDPFAEDPRAEADFEAGYALGLRDVRVTHFFTGILIGGVMGLLIAVVLL